MTSKRVLVTGAAGFVGRHTLAPLTARGFEVHAIRRRPNDIDGVTWHDADLLTLHDPTELLREIAPTHLLHLAWATTPGAYNSDLDNLRWVQATLGLLFAFATAGGRRVVVSGSCAEYDWRAGLMTEDVTPEVPGTLYGRTKLCVSKLLPSFAAQAGFTWAWPRIFFLYGPHEHPARLVSSVCRALLEERPADCTHGRQIRDFLHVTDAADALGSILDGDFEGVVNVASGLPVSVGDVARAVATEIGRPDLLRLGARPTADGEPAQILADVGRLASDIGWTPHFDLERGIRDTVAWWRDRVTPPTR